MFTWPMTASLATIRFWPTTRRWAGMSKSTIGLILGGWTAIHQFCKVGAHAMTGASTLLLHDLPPFVMASGNTANAHGLNSEGLRRRGFSAEQINLLRRCYKIIYKNGLTLEQAGAEIAALLDSLPDAADSPVRLLAGFFDRVTRGIVR